MVSVRVDRSKVPLLLLFLIETCFSFSIHSDNCPNVANDQTDVDGDNVGDAW